MLLGLLGLVLHRKKKDISRHNTYMYMYLTLFCGSRGRGMGGWQQIALDEGPKILSYLR